MPQFDVITGALWSGLAASLWLAGSAVADPCKAALPKPGAVIAGPVTYIVDGDGLCVGARDGGVEIRLGDFNAPELREIGGRAARAALSAIALNRRIECVAGRRSFDRVVALCTLDGRALGDLMREAGIKEGGR